MSQIGGTEAPHDVLSPKDSWVVEVQGVIWKEQRYHAASRSTDRAGVQALHDLVVGNVFV